MQSQVSLNVKDSESVLEWCDIRKTQLDIAGFEDGRGPWAKDASSP